MVNLSDLLSELFKSLERRCPSKCLFKSDVNSDEDNSVSLNVKVNHLSTTAPDPTPVVPTTPADSIAREKVVVNYNTDNKYSTDDDEDEDDDEDTDDNPLEEDDCERKIEDYLQLFDSQFLADLVANINNYAENHIRRFHKHQNFELLSASHSPFHLFEDDTFPPVDRSVFSDNGRLRQSLIDSDKLSEYGHVIWRRASELFRLKRSTRNRNVSGDGRACMRKLTLNDIVMPADEAASNESDDQKAYDSLFSAGVTQGQVIGNCFFVAAATGISQNAALFSKVVPKNNTFAANLYTGLFHFRFYIEGEWYDICVDDYLPVGSDGKLYFCHNTQDSRDLWCALLEKAYAKLRGSYEALHCGGNTASALIDMSGGVRENYKIVTYGQFDERSEELDAFWRVLDLAKRRKAVICCEVPTRAVIASRTNALRNKGIVANHAYIVSDVYARREMLKSGGAGWLRLVKCVNPWGGGDEWNGDWSKGSPCWQSDRMDQDDRRKLEAKVKQPGHFWFDFIRLHRIDDY